MMGTPERRLGSEDEVLVFSCSGASDVGCLADRTARELTSRGLAKMLCLSNVSADPGPILAISQRASRILAISGCEANCTRRTLLQAGIQPTDNFLLSDQGMERGKTPATRENQATITAAAAQMLYKRRSS